MTEGWEEGLGGRWGGSQSPDCSSHLPCAPQVLRGGDPAEGQDFPADADGEGGNAHQGGPAWGPRVSAARVGRPRAGGGCSLRPALGSLSQGSLRWSGLEVGRKKRRRRGRGSCPPEALAWPRALGKSRWAPTWASLKSSPCRPGFYLWPSGGRKSPHLISGNLGLQTRRQRSVLSPVLSLADRLVPPPQLLSPR